MKDGVNYIQKTVLAVIINDVVHAGADVPRWCGKADRRTNERAIACTLDGVGLSRYVRELFPDRVVSVRDDVDVREQEERIVNELLVPERRAADVAVHRTDFDRHLGIGAELRELGAQIVPAQHLARSCWGGKREGGEENEGGDE